MAGPLWFKVDYPRFAGLGQDGKGASFVVIVVAVVVVLRRGEAYGPP